MPIESRSIVKRTDHHILIQTFKYRYHETIYTNVHIKRNSTHFMLNNFNILPKFLQIQIINLKMRFKWAFTAIKCNNCRQYFLKRKRFLSLITFPIFFESQGHPSAGTRIPEIKKSGNKISLADALDFFLPDFLLNYTVPNTFTCEELTSYRETQKQQWIYKLKLPPTFHNLVFSTDYMYDTFFLI